MNEAVPIIAMTASVLTLFISLLILGKVNALTANHDRQNFSSTPNLHNPVNVSDRVRELAADPRNKIQAIKVLRDETGLGLAEAKRVVEDVIRNG